MAQRRPCCGSSKMRRIKHFDLYNNPFFSQYLLPELQFTSCHHEWDPWQLVSGLSTAVRHHTVLHVKFEHHVLSAMRTLPKDVQRHPGALTAFDWFAALCLARRSPDSAPSTAQGELGDYRFTRYFFIQSSIQFAACVLCLALIWFVCPSLIALFSSRA
jgi:hypothetical protein